MPLLGIRSAPLAVWGSASAHLHDLSRADAAIRAPLPLNRRIGVVQLAGGTGASIVAASLASIFATRRTGLILGVNASAGTNNMLWQAGIVDNPGASALGLRPLRAFASPSSAAEAADGLLRSPAGLVGLDLRDRAQPTTPAPSRIWFDQINPISRFFDLVVTDWGVRGWQIDLAQVTQASHVVCVVCRSERHAVEEAAAVLPALRGLEDGPRVVLVIVDVGGTASRGAPGAPAPSETPVIRIPYDPSSGSATPQASAARAARTRISHALLAGTVMTEAHRSLAAGREHSEARR
ncbi:hypothetical protein [Cryobacterium sp. PH29-G1]|uniref:hypothetical protein n=1 Tax=Cryobacterium sp. PH29-G1 TaxID=3046211 RepID=UPI0024B8A673|nr:hypothetical protein [Cryobacterium sp. PH29-G1]MDJ0350056.1 hypothetical protein [Cryobacterium sp. PH29-G1]